MSQCDITSEGLEKDDENKALSDSHDVIKRELSVLAYDQAEKYDKILKEIKKKMKNYKDDLLNKCEEQRDTFDQKALKEHRLEFESTHKSFRYLVWYGIWERLKYSDPLSDHLMDTIYSCFDDYMKEYRNIDEETRVKQTSVKQKEEEVDIF